ncbi:hypothetical protein KP509_35G036800 [Ceratopteris richardii]|uniref:THH1/TOM1/TOM3 domain-containing protein n=1 Tax=Ceratopteris richardii TaxID=49495 RepID=A0A8T2QG04_CERRI|nr:hypothetical protein KP509_35G036800 [Ceratopteris richardii]
MRSSLLYLLRIKPELHMFNTINVARGMWETSSNTLQEGVFYALCAAYSLVGVVAAIQLIRIQHRAPEYGWTTQKVFHLMNFIVNAARALVFGFYKNVFSFKIQILKLVLLEVPGLIFFSTYTLLVLFWAEIYYQARSMPTSRIRPTFFYVNALVYCLQLVIWLLEWLDYSTATRIVARIFFSAVSFVAALGFALYGGRLFLMLREFPAESKGRQKKLREIGSITVICFSCFLIRTIALAISACNEIADVNMLSHPVLNLCYYMVIKMLYSISNVDALYWYDI